MQLTPRGWRRPRPRVPRTRVRRYELVREHAPELFARVLEHVRTGRWEAATCEWIEGDENMASGEALARQLLEGVRWTRETLGVQPELFHAPDTFGHAGNVPQ